MVSEPTAGAAPKFDPDRTALVLVEFQRQWTDPGPYNLLVRRSLAKHDVVERTRDTVRAARDAGVLVVHAPLVIDLENKRGWLATLTRGLVFTESTPRVAFTPGLYCEGDPVVEGRYTFDAFEGSDLRTILWANGVETVFFAGFSTDQCIARSMGTPSNGATTPTCSPASLQRTAPSFNAASSDALALGACPRTYCIAARSKREVTGPDRSR